MTCPDCKAEVATFPCACGYQPTKADTRALEWAVVICEHYDTCLSKIRYPIGIGYTDIQPCQRCRIRLGLPLAHGIKKDGTLVQMKVREDGTVVPLYA